MIRIDSNIPEDGTIRKILMIPIFIMVAIVIVIWCIYAWVSDKFYEWKTGYKKQPEDYL